MKTKCKWWKATKLDSLGGGLPLDMLRYDDCFCRPELVQQEEGDWVGKPGVTEAVLLMCRPTGMNMKVRQDRWRSFGWKIEPLEGVPLEAELQDWVSFYHDDRQNLVPETIKEYELKMLKKKR